MEKKNRINLRAVLMLFSVLFSLFFTPSLTYAEESTETENLSFDTSLKISPTAKRVSINANESKEDYFTVENTGSGQASFYIYAAPFSESKNGTQQDFKTENTYNQIYKWIKFEDDNAEYVERLEESLLPGESKDFHYRLEIPENAPAGGQYATLFAEVKKDENDTSTIRAISRIGVLLLASISGEIKHDIALVDIKSGLTKDKKIGVETTLTNNGNIESQVSIDVKVTSLFGKEIYRNTNATTIYPETTKVSLNNWEETPPIGFFWLAYKISSYNIDEYKTQFVIITPFYIYIVITIIVILIVVGIKRRKNNNVAEK